MRGKITRQELHQNLLDELSTHSKFIVSLDEPLDNLVDGLIWFNPVAEVSKIYFNGKFNDLNSSGGSGGLTGIADLKIQQSRSTLLTESDTVTINMPEFRKELGYLEVIANGTKLYPEDYRISDDSQTIIKKNGTWGSHGGKTDFLFVFFTSINSARSATPFLKPVIRESFYIADGSEAAIPIDINEFDSKKHKLMVYYNGIAVKEGVHYAINSTGLAIRLSERIEPLDEFLFRIVDYSEPEYVIMLPDGTLIEPSNFVYEKIDGVVLDTSEPVINLRDGLIWINPSDYSLKVYEDGSFKEVTSSGGSSVGGDSAHLGPEEPTEEYSMWYKTI